MLYNVVLVSAYSKVNQPYIYIFPFFLGFLSHLGHCRALSMFLVLYSRISLIIYFINSHVLISIPICQSTPSPLPLSIHTFVLYISVSISALQISLSGEKIS